MPDIDRPVTAAVAVLVTVATLFGVVAGIGVATLAGPSLTLIGVSVVLIVIAALLLAGACARRGQS